jgi:hypothetical protein
LAVALTLAAVVFIAAAMSAEQHAQTQIRPETHHVQSDDPEK